MAHRNFRGRGISQAQRRKKTWFQAAEVLTGFSANIPGFSTSFGFALTAPGIGGSSNVGTLALLSGNGSADSPFKSNLPEESTILRIRGSLVFPKNIYGAAGNITGEFAVGYGVTSIGTSSVLEFPGPIRDASWDGWMFRREGATAPVDPTGSIVDIKAMRKVKSGDVFFVSFEALNGDGSAAAEQQWFLDFRLLVLLP